MRGVGRVARRRAHYRRGAYAERILEELFARMGWAAVRSPGSRSRRGIPRPDVLAMSKECGCVAFEVKTGRGFCPRAEQLAALLEFSRRSGCSAFYAFYLGRGEWRFLPAESAGARCWSMDAVRREWWTLRSLLAELGCDAYAALARGRARDTRTVA